MAAHESTGFTVSFATVEKALLKMHDVEPQHEEAWRSRINFLRREGVLGERPGSGRRIGYHTTVHLPKLLLALELAQAAVAPQVALSLIATSWDNRLHPIFENANKTLDRGGSADVLLLLAGITQMIERDGAIPVIATTTADRLDVLQTLLSDKAVPGRALVINITARLRRFHAELVEIYPQPEDHALDRRREKAEGETKTRGQGQTKARAKGRTSRRRPR
jgi:hypothetical protein